MRCAGAFAGALLFSTPFSGSAVLVKKDSTAFEMQGLESLDALQHMEDVSLSTALQQFRSHVNSSDAALASMAHTAFAQVKKQGSEQMLIDYARNAQKVVSDTTVDLNDAIARVMETMKGASGASVKELARRGLAALEESGARKELRRLLKSSASITCPFVYCPFALQAGMTVQGSFPFASAMNGGYLVDIFLVGNGYVPVLSAHEVKEEKICVSLRVGASDPYSGRFEKMTKSVFVGLTSWDAMNDETNKLSWGVAGGPRTVDAKGFMRIPNFMSAEVSFPANKRRFGLAIDNVKVSYCYSDPAECSEELPNFQAYVMLFGEYTLCM